MELLAAACYYRVPSRLGIHWQAIQPLQHVFCHPNLAGSPLEDVPGPSHFELQYDINSQFNSVVSSVTGKLCESCPTINTQVDQFVDLAHIYCQKRWSEIKYYCYMLQSSSMIHD